MKTTQRNASATAAAFAAAIVFLVAPAAMADKPFEPAWHPFTSGRQTGVNSTVSALTEWNGDLIAGGYFTTVGGQTVNGIAIWSPQGAPAPGDLNGDGVVDGLDLLILLANWG